ncbi:carboxymuconolactone decarboxylase family protein [Planococcus lenghuensis]|uniref:Carboxymuconolactone decarboxylase n=1 Tax=Planococcus lenghuensis TaxID=2213202 RepID=A0A1Q2L2K3_9BACL|nr:carboxymuconolactone decarboxylase family protein [Planococcus lenghuensis]AQQ54643.1 carboxymuconolactone decarboxylase [Planococcus lenghuensis]
MRKSLDYFKEVYDEVPGWVQKMHDYGPDVLDNYTKIRGGIMQDRALSRKEKDALIASMNAARLYERSMLFHTKGAIDFGYSVPELAEFFLTAYLYRGDQALALSLEAVAYALELKGKTVKRTEQTPNAAADSLRLILAWLDGEDTAYLERVLAAIEQGNTEKTAAEILSDGQVSSRLKQLNMAGNHIMELDGKGAAPWIVKSRNAGASEAELADMGYICILTAGIPAWFELSDSLNTIE